MIYLNERGATLHWDESCQSVLVEWKIYTEGEEYRAIVESSLNLMKQKRGTRYLVDARQLGPIRQIDQTWMNNEWFPRAFAAGLRSTAIVSPKAAVARLSVKQLMGKINNVNYYTAYFDDIEAARQWLLIETPPSG